VFVEWYRAGLIYRGNRLVNWDPVLGTAVSDLEVNNVERDGHMWSIRYPVVGSEESVVVATTRPETMLGDVAVAVHPEDKRYAHLVGKLLKLPLSNREIPVIADDYVDKDFGTGCVKITPAHDFNDYAIWERHKDELSGQPGHGLLTIFDLSAKLLGEPTAALHPATFIGCDLDLEPDEFLKHVASLPEASETEPSKKSLQHDTGQCFFAHFLIPKKYRGLDRYDARKRMLADLEIAELLVETKPHKLQVPVSDRSDAVIEPMLTDQWFVDLTSDTLPDGRPGGRKAITEPALDAVRSGEIKFVPENWTSTYIQWLGNIQDWCISRQLWWGHQIPAWYDIENRIFVAESKEEATQEYRNTLSADIADIDKILLKDEANSIALDDQVRANLLARRERLVEFSNSPSLRQDHDVLDTWFSSALWPFSTLGWPANGPVKNERGEIVANWEDDKIFLPSAVLVTGFDIIFFWVARMVMATKYFTGQIPFRKVYINAIVRDAEGKKMSKSKGNTLDPLDLIDGIELQPLLEKSTKSLLIPQVREKVEKRIRKDYPDGIPSIGTDALRFTFAALASYSRTINFDIKRAEGYKAFCNKLWNAARFVLMNVAEGEIATATSAPATEAERWILTRLRQTLSEVEQHFVSYRFDHLAQALYEFVWNEFCDWFLELSKPALSGNDADAAASTRRTLLVVLESVLRALHPVIPFITEEIWQELPATAKRAAASASESSKALILECSYPRADDYVGDDAATAEVEWFKNVLSGIRRIRSEMNISPAKIIPLLLAGGDANDRARIAKFAAQISFLARVEAPQWIDSGADEPAAAAAVVGTLRVMIPLAGLIDLGAEKARMAKEITRIETEIKKCEGKLSNTNFVANAPAEVVQQERQRITDWTQQISALRDQAQKLG
jgi:valyl-tRNA synthetase